MAKRLRLVRLVQEIEFDDAGVETAASAGVSYTVVDSADDTMRKNETLEIPVVDRSLTLNAVITKLKEQVETEEGISRG